MSLWTGAVSTDWNTAGNWTTDGVSTGVPDATKDAIFNGTSSNNCTTGTTARNCRDLITTGYTGVLTVGSSTAGIINVNRNLTLGSSSGHIAGSAPITILPAACTLDVDSAFTVPELSFAHNINSGIQTITLVRSFAIRNVRGAGASGTQIQMNAASGSMNMDIVSGGAMWGSAFRGTTVTARFFGTSSMGIIGTGLTASLPLQTQSSSTVSIIGSLSLFSTVAGGSLDASLGTLVSTGSTLVTGGSLSHTVNLGSTNALNNFSFPSGTATTVVMSSDFRCAGNFAISGTTTFSGSFDIFVGGNISGGTLVTSSRKIVAQGTSSGTSTVLSPGISLSTTTIEVACGTNAFTMASGAVLSLNSGSTFLFTSCGTWTTTGSTLGFTGALTACFINMNGSTNAFSTISNAGGAGRALTLLSNVVADNLTSSSGDVINGSGLTLSVSTTASLSTVSGTATLRFISSNSGNWTQVASSVNSLAAIVFQKTGGVLSIPNSFTYSGATGITYVSGTISHTATLTVTSVTLNTNGMSWNNITTSAGITLTLNSLLTVTNAFSFLGSVTFAGSAGFTAANIGASTLGTTIILVSGLTHTCTTSMLISASAASPINFRASLTNSTKAIFTLNPGATQGNFFINATDIDSSLGQTVWDVLGGSAALTRTINWNSGTPQATTVEFYAS